MRRVDGRLCSTMTGEFSSREIVGEVRIYANLFHIVTLAMTSHLRSDRTTNSQRVSDQSCYMPEMESRIFLPQRRLTCFSQRRDMVNIPDIS